MGYRAICDQYRAHLLDGYDEYERSRPSELLLCGASILYKVCYENAQQVVQSCPERQPALALAWNVAGPWLCVIKAMRIGQASRPGLPSRPVAATVLRRVIAHKQLPADEAGGEGGLEP